MDSSSRETSIHENPVSQAFLWPAYWAIRLFFLSLTLLLVTWGTYLGFMHFEWGPSNAIEHTRVILAYDLDTVTRVGGVGSGSDSGSGRIAIAAANSIYWLVWEATRIHEAMTAFADPSPRGMLDTFLRNVLIVPFSAEIYVLMDATKIFGIRFSVFITALPLFFLAYAVGSADGLVQRYIRRAGAGRESSSLYHRAKYFQMGGAAFLGLIYVCLPIAIDPRWIMLPAAAVLALLSRIQWTYFKKYL